MSRETLLQLALGMLIASALVVGLSGWMLVVRERRLARATASGEVGTGEPVAHAEAHEER
jgi:hypothetical protein